MQDSNRVGRSATGKSRGAKRKRKNSDLEEKPMPASLTNTAGTVDVRERPDNPLFYSGLYAPSGFDIMSILIRVATRPNPQIHLGAIDSNCALLMCDAFAEDIPIVYCSEAFEFLTGYKRAEVLGRNCRFLQSPQGPLDPCARRPRAFADKVIDVSDEHDAKSDVEPGVLRVEEIEHDEEKLYKLKTHIARKEEAQITVTNYKKGGIAFTNVLTTIPVRWASDSDQLRYIVGFQADRMGLFV